MRYSASEKLEIIELVEQSTLSVGRTLASKVVSRFFRTFVQATASVCMTCG